MKTTKTLLFGVASLALAHGVAVQAADFRKFEGLYSRHGAVSVSSGRGVFGHGKVKIRFAIGNDGKSARLKLSGTMTVGGSVRPFMSIIALRNGNTVAISNLAPGIDDGHAVEGGSYSVGPAGINVTVPFTSSTTRGSAIFVIRLKVQQQRTRLSIKEQFTTSAIVYPIIWRFFALLSR